MGHYGAYESQNDECEHFVRNGGLGSRLFRSKFRLAHRIARSPEAWPAKSVSCNPLTNWESNFVCKPERKRGRPSAPWDDTDTLTNFSTILFHNEKWWHVASEISWWLTSERFYVQFCRALFTMQAKHREVTDFRPIVSA